MLLQCLKTNCHPMLTCCANLLQYPASSAIPGVAVRHMQHVCAGKQHVCSVQLSRQSHALISVHSIVLRQSAWDYTRLTTVCSSGRMKVVASSFSIPAVCISNLEVHLFPVFVKPYEHQGEKTTSQNCQAIIVRTNGLKLLHIAVLSAASVWGH